LANLHSFLCASHPLDAQSPGQKHALQTRETMGKRPREGSGERCIEEAVWHRCAIVCCRRSVKGEGDSFAKCHHAASAPKVERQGGLISY
jgi:hypothetical protein